MNAIVEVAEVTAVRRWARLGRWLVVFTVRAAVDSLDDTVRTPRE